MPATHWQPLNLQRLSLSHCFLLALVSVKSVSKLHGPFFNVHCLKYGEFVLSPLFLCLYERLKTLPFLTPDLKDL